MNQQRERIFVIDDDPLALDLLARQTLEPAGFIAQPFDNGNDALRQIPQLLPSLIVVSLNLSGFSGKDLLAALRAQQLAMPVIVTARPDQQEDILDAFRLGAYDYIEKPLREAEVIAAVDRVMTRVGEQREREMLRRELEETNTELEERVRELTILFGIGKAITNLTDLESLFTRLVEATLYVTGAKMGWLLMADERSGKLVLQAARNAPASVQALVGKPWHAGLGPMVMLSGEPLNMAGNGLQRFQAGQFARAVLVAPIVVRDTSVGVLVVANDQPRPFSERHQAMLMAVADYASIAVVNMRLFQALAKQADKPVRNSSGDFDVAAVRHALNDPLNHARTQIDDLLDGRVGKLSRSQSDALLIVNNKLLQTLNALDKLT